MKKVITIIGIVITLLSVAVNGATDFLSDALNIDQGMKALNEKISAFKDKQEESNVFSKKSLKVSSDTMKRIEQTRTENIANAIYS